MAGFRRRHPEAQKIAAAEREFRLALLQATETCRTKSVACDGGSTIEALAAARRVSFLATTRRA